MGGREGGSGWAAAEWLRELTRAVRSLARSPGFTGAAVVTLGVGLGATAAIFTLVDAILLRPLPYPNSERMVIVHHSLEDDAGPGGPADWPLARFAYALFEEENRSFEAFGGHWPPTSYTITGHEQAERVRGVAVTPGLFEVLGARPAAGRLFGEADVESGVDDLVVLSHGLWQRRYGGDRSVVGRSIVVDGTARRVLGVMADGIHLPETRIDLWLPYVVPPGTPPDDMFRIHVLARLHENIALEAAEADVERLTAGLPEIAPFYSTYLDEYGLRTRVRLVRDEIVREVERTLWILLGAVGIVLLIAAANVVNLFLGRTEGRTHEVAVRSALGAGRGHLLVHFLSESLVVAGVAGVLAVVLALVGTRVLVGLAPPSIPRLDELTVGPATVALVVALCFVLAALLAVYPHVRFRGRGGGGLTARGAGAFPDKRQSAGGGGLVVTQVALALVLLSGSALLFRSFHHLRSVDPGFDPEGVLVAELAVPSTRYPSPEEVGLFYRRVLERVASLPGVRGAALGPSPIGATGCSGLYVEGRSVPEGTFPPCVPMTVVSPGYWEVLDVPVEAGRTFTEADLGQPTSVVATRTLARRLWPEGDPLRAAVHPSPRSGPPWYPVIGVVGAVRGGGPAEPPTEMLYMPIRSDSDYEWLRVQRTTGLLVRAEPGREEAVAGSLRQAVAEFDPDVPVTVQGTLEEALARSMVRTSFTLFLLGTAAVTALVLGLVGLYGIMAWRVGTRRAEIGVRMAMGARGAQVRDMVLGHSLRLLGLGTVLGLAGALLTTRFLESFLHGVRPGDPWMLAAAAAALLVTGLVASWIPARRATRVDPATVLRSE